MPVNPPSWRNDTVLPLPNEWVANAWAVDAACSSNPGRWNTNASTLRPVPRFSTMSPIHGTNNIGEFLAIVTRPRPDGSRRALPIKDNLLATA